MQGIDHKTGRTVSGWALFVTHAKDVITTQLGSRQKRRNYGSRCPELLGQSNSPYHQMLLRAYVAQAFVNPVNGLVDRFSLTKVQVSAREGGVTLRLHGTYMDQQHIFEVIHAH